MKVDSSLLFKKTGIFQSFELGALWAFVLSSDFLLRYFRHMASVICFFVNAMTAIPWHSQITLLIFYSFALFSCAWISVCSWFKKPEDRFLSGGCRFDKFLTISMSLGRRCSTVTSWTTANQDCHGTSARARLYKSPLAAAVQSRRPVLIECGNLPALALPRDKLVIATARRRGRDRAQAPVNAKQPLLHRGRVYVHEKYSNKYCWKYIQIYCQIYCWKYVHILLDIYACIF